MPVADRIRKRTGTRWQICGGIYGEISGYCGKFSSFSSIVIASLIFFNNGKNKTSAVVRKELYTFRN
jgi:hypothetical protein